MCIIVYFMNGPQVGSLTSPTWVVKRCLIRPSVETMANDPRRPDSVAYMMYLPFGEKLGDSSLTVSDRRCSWPLLKSSAYSWNLPSRREINAKVRPSGEIRGLML